ncbi:MAG: metal-dependent hydrolase [Nanoarchaeota archaeon]|nr:metal-dependent hydrolase [Nanoarchaeota archaeon]MBU1946474.1 metal-dependent hydrolase [Nanoarchaeota archaeon]
MLSRTHLAFGFLIGLYLIDFLNIKSQILFMLILLFFTIFPDIDESSSKISKKTRPFSFISNLTGHRSIFHTIYFPVAISLTFFMFKLKELSIAALAGYLLHLVLDSTTKQGIMLFYPISKKRFNGFIKVGSLIENLVFVILVGLIIYELIL